MKIKKERVVRLSPQAEDELRFMKVTPPPKPKADKEEE